VHLTKLTLSSASLVITTESQFPIETPAALSVPNTLCPPNPNLLDLSAYITDKTTLDILIEIRSFCFAFDEYVRDETTSVVGNIGIHPGIGVLLQKLLPKHQQSSLSPLSQASRYAAAIYLFLLFDNHFPDPTLLLNSLLHKLKSALDSILPCAGEVCYLVWWLLSVGGVVAAKLPAERDWFVSNLVETASDLDLNNWEDMKGCLKKVIWLEVINESPFQDLWQEVVKIAQCESTCYPFSAIRDLTE
jgi:hypothetical protein